MERINFQSLFGDCDMLTNEPMSRHTSFAIGGPADYMVSPSSALQIAQIVSSCREKGVPFTVIGKGSNLLVSDGGIEGVVICLDSHFSEYKYKAPDTLYAQAGLPLISLCRFALENGLSELEFAYGIPGSVGGAVYMNAGAYEHELSSVLRQVEVLTAQGEVIWRDTADCKFSYRKSIFMNNGDIILGARFQLIPAEKATIKTKMEEYMSRRRGKQPLEYPSAGSVFKRPPGQFASALIEQNGLKDTAIGGAKVSEKHAGFIINTGGATAADVTALINHIREVVKNGSGVELETEVRIIGR